MFVSDILRPSILFALLLAGCDGKDVGIGNAGVDSGAVDQDQDGDGYLASDDCDDEDPKVNPAVDEECDDVDNNCDGQIDEGVTDTYYADTDGDGFGDLEGATESCAAPAGYVPNADDCDDGDADIYPNADEACDGLDNDCDDEIDDGASDGDATEDWYLDADGDGYGDVGSHIEACGEPDGYVQDTTDCDDASATTHPDADELCNDLDDDCDSAVDEDAVDPSAWYNDADEDGYGDAGLSEVGCDAPNGYVGDGTDCDDARDTVNPGADELCDTLDNDCDGTVDEDATDADTWYADSDSDGYGDADETTVSCDAPVGYTDDSTDCDDDKKSTNPGAKEKCDDEDDDCDGSIDEGATDASTWYADDDADGYGDVGTTSTSCDAPTGYTSDATDCDDTDSGVHPGASEYCDAEDDDCDGSTDESAVDATTWYKDRDADTYGDAATTSTSCTAPTGYVALSTDCDDRDSGVHPSASEYCDGEDDDCDGTIDESAVDSTTWYKDRDSDDFGDAATSSSSCSAPTGYVADGTDCDDRAATTYPGADEVCEDGSDNDCDGIDAPCGPTGDVPLAGSDAWMYGETAYDYAGSSVSAAGDVNADGYGDLLVGAIGDDTKGSAAGAAYVVNGPISGDMDLSAADAKLTGEAKDDKAGSAVAGTGDVDGDGYDDILVGAKQESTGGSYAGASYLLLGPISSVNLSRADAKIKGAGTYEYMGNAVANAGDMDGDGLDDLLLGAYGEDAAGTSAGAALLFYSPVSGTTSTSAADEKLTGEKTYDFAGYALDAAGDTDGDGLGDLLVGAYGEDTAGSSAGAAYLVMGGSTGTTSLSTSDAKFTGSSASEYAGCAVAGAGDVNGDGYADILIGAYGYSSETGRSYLVLGPVSGTVKLSVADAILGGENTGDRAGYALDGAGDTDGDGYADLIIGAYREDTGGADAGAGYLVHGPISGSSKLSAATAKMTGEAKGDYVGYAVAGAGDIDGDTFDDLLLGAMKRDDGGADAGGAYLVFGGED